MKKFEENLKKEQDRTKEMLRKKLEERRKKKKSLEVVKLKEGFHDEMKGAHADEKKRLAALQTEGAKVLTSAVPGLASKSMHEKETGQENVENEALQEVSQSQQAENILSPQYAPGVPPMTDQALMNMLANSPLQQTVNDIEEMIKDGVKPSGVLGAKGRPFIDIKDAQWVCQGELIPVDINELNPTQFVVYRFGVFVTQILQELMNVPEVTLLIAESLPLNNYSKNAFRNSFFYEDSRKILFVRKERMDSVGDFVVLLIHCLAHIKSGDMCDDNNVNFMKEFYKGMRICCQDMFFSRARSSAHDNQLKSIPSTGNTSMGKPLEHAFKLMKQPSTKLNAMKELVDVKVSDPVNHDYTSEGVTERISKHNTFVDNAKLRAYLRSVGAFDNIDNTNKFTPSIHLTKIKMVDNRRKSAANQLPTRSSRISILSPTQLLDNQLEEIHGKIDNLNNELTNILKTTFELNKSLKTSEANGSSNEFIERKMKQKEDYNLRKDNIMKKLKLLENELQRKEKEKTS